MYVLCYQPGWSTPWVVFKQTDDGLLGHLTKDCYASNPRDAINSALAAKDFTISAINHFNNYIVYSAPVLKDLLLFNLLDYPEIFI